MCSCAWVVLLDVVVVWLGCGLCPGCGCLVYEYVVCV